MERESLLSLLIVLLGGVLLQACACWPSAAAAAAWDSALQRERRCAAQLWRPMLPAVLVAVWLCGWALTEPDPVPDRVDRLVLLATCAPFAFVFARALLRALWSLLQEPDGTGAATVGFIRPQVVFSPFLARQLDERVMRAALAHERAHVRHRDPLRSWLAQLACDLQWPWPSAQQRLRAWLMALECARDEEARAAGIDGADLAAAVLASVRFQLESTNRAAARGRAPSSCAQLIGDPAVLRRRVSRLLHPLTAPEHHRARAPSAAQQRLLLLAALVLALVLGSVFGEHLIHPLLTLLA